MRLALSCATQWRWCPQSGEPLGLIYEGVDRAARWLGLDSLNPFFIRAWIQTPWLIFSFPFNGLGAVLPKNA